MSKRSEEWLDQFGPIANSLEPDVKALVLDGSIEVCPVCQELSAYAYQDTTAYDEDEDAKPAKGTIASIGACGGDEFQCGHCRAYVMLASSPLNHPCYTHEDVEDDE